MFGAIISKTTKCLQAASIWVIDAKTFHSVCHWNMQTADEFLKKIVSKTPGFEGAEAWRLINALVMAKFKRGTDILANTPRCSLYIVFGGEVNILKGYNDHCKKFGHSLLSRLLWNNDVLWARASPIITFKTRCVWQERFRLEHYEHNLSSIRWLYNQILYNTYSAGLK